MNRLSPPGTLSPNTDFKGGRYRPKPTLEEVGIVQIRLMIGPNLCETGRACAATNDNTYKIRYAVVRRRGQELVHLGNLYSGV